MPHPAPLLRLAAPFLLSIATATAADLKPLRDALTRHAPFDADLDATFSRGDRKPASPAINAADR
jgi:hypothetical protein